MAFPLRRGTHLTALFRQRHFPGMDWRMCIRQNANRGFQRVSGRVHDGDSHAVYLGYLFRDHDDTGDSGHCTGFDFPLFHPGRIHDPKTRTNSG